VYKKAHHAVSLVIIGPGFIAQSLCMFTGWASIAVVGTGLQSG